VKRIIEERTFAAKFSVDSDGKQKIKGTASVFNVLSQDLGGFKEIIDPWAFGPIVNTNDVFALINHDPNLVLGRNISKTLSLEENENGLDFVVDPPDTSFANDLLVSMARGDMDKCSFAFVVDTATWEVIDGWDVRRIKKFAELWDVSIVTYPAFYQTSAQVFGRDILTPKEVYAEYRSINLQRKQEQLSVGINIRKNKLAIYERLIVNK
jgi:hypothetical protein